MANEGEGDWRKGNKAECSLELLAFAAHLASPPLAFTGHIRLNLPFIRDYIA